MLTPVQRAHLILYSQIFSPNGNHLAIGSNFGYVAVFNISNFSSLSTSENADSTDKTPIMIWNLHSDGGGSYSLASNETFLFSGSLGEICAVSWSNVSKSSDNELPKVSYKLKIPRQDSFSIPEVNSLCSDADPEFLYAGCGDNKIHTFDLSTGQLVASISKHKGYIHSISRAGNNELLSACESGTVCVWDLRHSNSREVQRFVPSDNPDLARPHLGPWITSARCDGDWLVCGGGPKLAVWNRKAMKYTSILQPNHNENYWSPYSIRFYGDKILGAGNAAQLYHWFIDGSLTASVPTTANHILNIASPGSLLPNVDSPSDKLFVCGSSKYIDVFAGIGYRMLKLQV